MENRPSVIEQPSLVMTHDLAAGMQSDVPVTVPA
jgi:hypothetical protein